MKMVNTFPFFFKATFNFYFLTHLTTYNLQPTTYNSFLPFILSLIFALQINFVTLRHFYSLRYLITVSVLH